MNLIFHFDNRNDLLKRLLAIIVILFSSLTNAMAEVVVISGYVEDSVSKERLIGANVFIESQKPISTVTNAYGFYSISVPEGRYNIRASHIGYEIASKPINVTNNLSVDFQLHPSSTELAEVLVRDRQSSTNVLSLDPKEVSSIPVLFGEADVLKAVQMLPGVQGGAEGFVGMHVRGGSPDQNLILLDGVQVYNASHLFGFFSVFNPDVVKNVRLTKGSFPAKYNGRLSSILEVDLKEGNMKKWEGVGSLGLISSKLTLEGPLVHDKVSFLISGRRTYYDLLLKLLTPPGDRSLYYFGDINAKVNYKISRNDRVYLSVYGGQDRYNNEESGGNISFDHNLKWGNRTAVARWNHLFSDQLFSNLTAVYSKYRLETNQEELATLGSTTLSSIQNASIIEDYGLRYDLEQKVGASHHLNYGLNYTYHQFNPSLTTLSASGGTNIEPSLEQTNNIPATEIALYAEDNWEVTSKFNMSLGLNYSGYIVQNSYYDLLQPRFSMTYKLSAPAELSVSYSLMNQYVHLLSNVGFGLPTDLWVTSTDQVKPQQAQQVSVGGAYFSNTYGLEFSIAGYYKRMSDLITYREGATFEYLTNWENLVTTNGIGSTYGMEFLTRKRLGKLSGWLSYTLSWSNRRFDDINSGEWYPYKYDRRHKINVVGNYKITDNISTNMTWTYMSGHAFTSPSSVYLVSSVGGLDRNTLIEYSPRNAFRFPDYHRLDASISFSKKKNFGQRTWSIGVYNLYNRMNPFYIYARENEATKKVEAKQVTLFPIIPSVVYTYRF